MEGAHCTPEGPTSTGNADTAIPSAERARQACRRSGQERVVSRGSPSEYFGRRLDAVQNTCGKSPPPTMRDLTEPERRGRHLSLKCEAHHEGCFILRRARMRMRSSVDAPLPKPMMPIGTRPVLWHIMRYYAHFGHNEFILCLGYGAHSVKDYFLDYHETHSNDFVLSNAGRTVELLSSDISDWRITFADTGLDTPIGERLRRVRDYLGDDEVFLANYGDVLTDAPMNDLIDNFLKTDAVGSLLAVAPQDSFHVVRIDGESRLTGIEPVVDMDMRINGGYFILRRRSSTT